MEIRKENLNRLQAFLSMYYVLDAVCDDSLSTQENVAMYARLADVFCLPIDDTMQHYYEVSRQDQFRNIKTLRDYNRLSRLINFAQSQGRDVGIDRTDSLVLAQKREAMTILDELFDKRSVYSKDSRVDMLLSKAHSGNIAAMGALAFMEYNGFGIDADRDNAIRRLRACARWNDLFGLLMGVCYDAGNQQMYMNRLYTILHHVSQRDIFNHICSYRQIGTAFCKDEVAELLEKGFVKGVINRTCYDRDFAKVAFSVLLSVKDREKLLLQRKQNFEMTLPNLPFEVTHDGCLQIDTDYVNQLPLCRKNEQDQILDNLSVIQNCPAAAVRPLLVISSDPFVSEMYKDMLVNSINGVQTVRIDADKLDAYDVAESETNIFVRALSDTGSTRTVFIIENCEAAKKEIMDSLINMLEFEYRKKFGLHTVPIALDLSEMMFVLFSADYCQGMNELLQMCDVVRPDPVKEDERGCVVDCMFRASAAEFGLETLALENAGREYLMQCTVNETETILYNCMKAAACDKLALITQEMLRSVRLDTKKKPTVMGFAYTGGGSNE